MEKLSTGYEKLGSLARRHAAPLAFKLLDKVL
jgi:hypothetical protein